MHESGDVCIVTGKDELNTMSSKRRKRVPAWIFALFWCCCFAGFVFLQSTLGAWTSDLGGDPDEAAHAVTGLMVRDYLTHQMGGHPLKFAETYYARYPKVALGHYPPGYYLLSALVLLPKPSVVSLFVLQAGLAASVATLMAWVGAQMMSVSLSCIAGAVWCMTMPVLKLSMLVMADFFLVLMCLAAAVAFVFYMKSLKARWSLIFGILASLAILIKGSGWMLALLPPVAIVLSRCWRLLITPSLWLAPLPVLLLALPWQWFSFRFTEEGMSGMSPAEHLMAAMPFYGDVLVRHYGWLVAGVMGGAMVRLMWRWCHGAKVSAVESVWWALLFSGVVMMMVVPAGLTSRYFLPLSAPLLLLTVLELDRFSDWLKFPRWVKMGAITLAITLSSGSLLSIPLLNKEVTGFAEAVLMTVKEDGQRSDRGENTVLVCSDPRGEGAMIVAAAFDERARSLENFQMVRASKVLAEIDWLGRGNDNRFSNEEALLKFLKEERVGWVMVDQSVRAEKRPSYFWQLSKAMASSVKDWSLWREVQVRRSEDDGGIIQIYRHQAQEMTPGGSQ